MRRCISFLLIFVMVCTVFCACNSNEQDPVYDESAWYDSVRIHFLEEDTNSSYHYCCSDDEVILLEVVNYRTYKTGAAKVTRTGEVSEPVYLDDYEVAALYIKDGYHCLLSDDDWNYYDSLINYDEGTVTDIVPVDLGAPSGRGAMVNQLSVVDSHIVTLITYFDYVGNDDTYAIKIDDNIYGLDSVKDVFYFVDGGNGNIYVAACDDEIENPDDEYRRKYVKVDIDSGAMEDVIVRDGDMLRKFYNEWPPYHPDRLIRTDEKTHLVYEYDAGTDSEHVIFDMQKFSVNVDAMLFGTIVCSDPERPVVSSASPSGGGGNSLLLYSMSRSKTDPTEGKQILTIKSIDGTLDGYHTCSEAVYEFNRTNPDYFIKLAGEENEKFGEADAITEMISEIRSGTAPDILIGYGGYSAINDSRYLQDMSGYINTDELFVSSINPDTEGVIRIVPLQLLLRVIITEPSYLEDSDSGLTVDEYMEFVDRLPDKVDPMVGAGQYRMVYFENLLRTCSDCFFDESGRFNADNETFRRIAEYSARLPEQTSDNYSANIGVPVYVGCSEISSRTNISEWYLEPDSDLVMIGAPTTDGTGYPAQNIKDDVCVTVCCEDPEGAGQFINLLTSADILDTFEYSSLIPNNKTSFDHRCAQNKLPERMREQVYDALFNVSYFCAEDPELMDIIKEEIQPYFEGQKSLDETVEVINNRARTLMSEREG
ncbi:ABC-type glycerol-3-phosphate transport system, substrate-binding protein [Ruminococcaceae bacterium YRB3002]|nr:ABC-type glycerol-3-phosphate transport system, substrate-binding protein [Ruminococcaceae bacterium YRB3002]